MKREQGFTLIELMIVIAIIAIIAAIAIPGLLQSQIAANERNASASIKTLATVQSDFRSNDRDNDRSNNFWTDDVQGLYDLTDSTGNAIRLIDVTIANADCDVGGSGARGGQVGAPAPKSGYWYAAFDNYEVEPGSNDPGVYDQDGLGHHFSRFGVLAKPDSHGSSGRNHFIMNESGTVFKKNDPVTAGAGPVGFLYPVNPLDAASGYTQMD